MSRAVLAAAAICALAIPAPAAAAPRTPAAPRPAPAAAPLAAAALVSPRPATAPRGWRPDVSAAGAYARSRPGVVAFAVRTEARFWGFRADRAYPSASVVKAM